METKINVRIQLARLVASKANDQAVWSELHNNEVILYKVSLFINRHKRFGFDLNRISRIFG